MEGHPSKICKPQKQQVYCFFFFSSRAATPASKPTPQSAIATITKLDPDSPVAGAAGTGVGVAVGGTGVGVAVGAGVGVDAGS